MNAVERGTPPVPLAPPARDLTNPERRGLCIGCWYAECSGNHTDPDLACDCCMGRVQTR